MKHVAAYMMLTKAGKEVTFDSMTSLLKVINAAYEEETVRLFVSKIEGRSMEEMMDEGAKLMSSFAVAAPAQGGKAATEVKEAEAVQETQKEEEEFDLFAAF